MKLQKPIIIFDIESATVGLAPDPAVDKIVHMVARRYDAGSEFDINCTQEQKAWNLNPGFEMSKENVEIHGITNEAVSAYPLLTELIGKDINQFFAGCDLGGFNCTGYDIPLLWEELYRVGITFDMSGRRVFDAGNIFKKKEERTLGAAYKFYTGLAHETAHDAAGYVGATAQVLMRQLKHYPDLEMMTPDQLHQFCDMKKSIDLHGIICRNDKGEAVFGTKRNRGVRVMDDPGYAMWMLRSDFPQNTKMTIQRILNGGDNKEDADQDTLW